MVMTTTFMLKFLVLILAIRARQRYWELGPLPAFRVTAVTVSDQGTLLTTWLCRLLSGKLWATLHVSLDLGFPTVNVGQERGADYVALRSLHPWHNTIP